MRLPRMGVKVEAFNQPALTTRTLGTCASRHIVMAAKQTERLLPAPRWPVGSIGLRPSTAAKP